MIILIKTVIIVEPLILVIDLPVEWASMREDILLLLMLLLMRAGRQLSVRANATVLHDWLLLLREEGLLHLRESQILRGRRVSFWDHAHAWSNQ